MKENVEERVLSAYNLINDMVIEHKPSEPELITKNSKKKNVWPTKINDRYKEKRFINTWAKTTKKMSPQKMQRTQRLFDKMASTIVGNLDQPYDIHDDSKFVRNNRTEFAHQEFITRKSYESYQKKIFDSFDGSLNSAFNMSQDIDALIDDVSTPDEIKNVDHLDSLLSGDTELQVLINDVITESPGFLQNMVEDDLVKSFDNEYHRSQDVLSGKHCHLPINLLMNVIVNILSQCFMNISHYLNQCLGKYL